MGLLTPRRIQLAFGGISSIFIIAATALFFMLDGQSKDPKPDTYYVTYVARVINLICLVGNFVVLVIRKVPTEVDERLYSALKHGGIIVLSGCIVIYDPMANVSLTSTADIAGTAKGIFIVAGVFAGIFFVLNVILAVVKRKAPVKEAVKED